MKKALIKKGAKCLVCGKVFGSGDKVRRLEVWTVRVKPRKSTIKTNGFVHPKCFKKIFSPVVMRRVERQIKRNKKNK